ncbi:MAG: hypothetical protein AAFX80_00165 [Cyanobacteria bacterium J06639_18]
MANWTHFTLLVGLELASDVVTELVEVEEIYHFSPPPMLSFVQSITNSETEYALLST